MTQPPRLPRYVAIVPAAGTGSRMAADCPKQYLELLGRPLLWHALHTLTLCSHIEAVYVVLAPDDVWWARYDWSPLGSKLAVLRTGGQTRADSVAQALAALQGQVHAEDWVLVHDAARACLSLAHVEKLIAALAEDPVGGLLAVPVADTLKRADAAERVADTVARDALWQAQTPQMFRYGLLREALNSTRGLTDEAGAVEAMGKQPKLVAADATNFKVTYPNDIVLAAQILAARQGAS